jgi:hypothetical protein
VPLRPLQLHINGHHHDGGSRAAAGKTTIWPFSFFNYERKTTQQLTKASKDARLSFFFNMLIKNFHKKSHLLFEVKAKRTFLLQCWLLIS